MVHRTPLDFSLGESYLSVCALRRASPREVQAPSVATTIGGALLLALIEGGARGKFDTKRADFLFGIKGLIVSRARIVVAILALSFKVKFLLKRTAPAFSFIPLLQSSFRL